MRQTARDQHHTAPSHGSGDIESHPERRPNPKPADSENQAGRLSGSAGSPPEFWEPFVTFFGSEKPSHFAEILARTIPIEPEKTNVLDIGCGSGYIGIYCLMEKKARHVTFTDLRPEWLEITAQNVAIRINQGAIRQSQVTILKASPFADIPTDVLNEHDRLVFNPPQLPYKYADENSVRDIEGNPVKRAFRRGGPDGLDVVREFLGWYASLKVSKPDAVILLSSFLGRQLINRTTESYGLLVEILAETSAPLRKMFWETANELSCSERGDRSIRKAGEGWTKQLITCRITSK